MCSSISMPRFALLALLLLSLTKAQQTAYESIFTVDAFATQPTCVQNCFTQGYANINCFTDVLGEALGCPNSPCSSPFAAVDGCYCRGDLQTVAQYWLSSCIDLLCTVGENSVNLAAAESIYSGYCTGRGFEALPAQNTAETTSQGGVSASTTSNAGSGPVSTSLTSSSNTNTTSASPASTSNTLTIALASISVVAAIAILVAAMTCWKIRQRKRLANANPYHLKPMPVSTHLLPPSQGSQYSHAPTDVTPSDSVSQVNQPGMMAPSFPHHQQPSTIVTNAPGYGASTVMPRRNMPRYQGGMR